MDSAGGCLELEQSYIHNLKALMCVINASRWQGHGCRFTMCQASLKMALLLHKEGLVKTTVPITVNSSCSSVIILMVVNRLQHSSKIFS